MKRRIAVAAASGVIGVLSLTACGGSTDPVLTPASTPAVASVAPVAPANSTPTPTATTTAEPTPLVFFRLTAEDGYLAEAGGVSALSAGTAITVTINGQTYPGKIINTGVSSNAKGAIALYSVPNIEPGVGTLTVDGFAPQTVKITIQ